MSQRSVVMLWQHVIFSITPLLISFPNTINHQLIKKRYRALCFLELCLLSYCYETKPTLLHCQAQVVIATYSFNVLATSIHLDGTTWYWFPSDRQIRQWKVSNSKLSTRNNLGSIFLNTTNIKINQTKMLGPFPMFLNTLFLFIKQKSCISLTIDLIVSILHICIEI